MKGIIGIVVLCVLVAGSWFLFDKTGGEMRELQAKVEEMKRSGDEGEELSKLKAKVAGIEGERVFNGILLAMLSAALVGIVFVTQLLPMFVQKLTHAVYDSGEQVEADPMHDARVLVAQGEWEAAIEAFREGALRDPGNRMPWVEIAKIQRVNLEDPQAAVETLRGAIQDHEWEVNDVSYLMFRLAEIYDEDMGDRGSAVAIMEQLMEQFPDTRHAANARTKLHEWGIA